jgi:hypothetical protein
LFSGLAVLGQVRGNVSLTLKLTFCIAELFAGRQSIGVRDALRRASERAHFPSRRINSAVESTAERFAPVQNRLYGIFAQGMGHEHPTSTRSFTVFPWNISDVAHRSLIDGLRKRRELKLHRDLDGMLFLRHVGLNFSTRSSLADS